jgi:hypothetical protein
LLDFVPVDESFGLKAKKGGGGWSFLGAHGAKDRIFGSVLTQPRHL